MTTKPFFKIAGPHALRKLDPNCIMWFRNYGGTKKKAPTAAARPWPRNIAAILYAPIDPRSAVGSIDVVYAEIC